MRSGKYKLGGITINRNLVSGKCRMLDCRFYHKYIKDLKRHLERAHDMSLASHNKLPPSLLSNVIKNNKGKSYMKHRKVELCSIKRCKQFMQPLTDLTGHLKRCHNGMTKKEYYSKRNVKVAKNSTDWTEEKQQCTSTSFTEFSDDERSDLLDSDVTLSPFYPPSEYDLYE